MRAPKFLRLQVIAMMAIALLALPGVALAYAPTGDDFIECVPATPSPGATVNCTAGEFEAGASINVTVTGGGATLLDETVTADGDGVASFTFSVPADFDADDDLTVTVDGSDKVLAVQVNVERISGTFVECDKDVNVPGGSNDCSAGNYDAGSTARVKVTARGSDTVALAASVLAQAGSTDIVLLEDDFTVGSDNTFDFSYDVPDDLDPDADILIEVVGQQNGIGGVEATTTVEVAPDEDGDGLPDTGIEAGGLLLTALGAIVIGGGVLALGRRRTRTTV